MTHYDFDREFRVKILSLLLDPKWAAIYGTTIILPEFFEADDERDVCEILCDYIQTYNIPPLDPLDVIVALGNDSDKYREFVYDLYDYDMEFQDMEFTSDVVVQFAKEQAAKNAVLDSVDDIKRGNLPEVLKKLEEALKVGNSVLLPGTDFIEDIDTWLYDYWEEKVRTGWIHIDRILQGGLGPGELGIIMAPVNRGKSMALVNLGYNAAAIGSGVNVVHFTREMHPDQVQRRYASRMMFRFPTQKDDLGKYKEEVLASAKKLLRGKIRVVDARDDLTIDDMRVQLDRLRADGFDFGLIIDDYPDLMPAPRRYTEHRFELSGKYDTLRKKIGVHYNVPVWGASQANRASLSKEVVTLSDISEDIGKANIADIIAALCQTAEEYESDQMRIFMAKVRDGKKNYMIDCKFYAEQQAIITKGYTKRKEE